jgi:polyisoprenoid-binding protein YceI
MRKFFTVFFILGILGAATPAQRAIDISHSSAQFSVQHIWVEHVTGTVPIAGGSVTLEPGSMIPTAATATLDATKISTGEPDRDRSLESPDFFDTRAFPAWTFASTKIVPKGPNAFDMDGELTIHGVTQPEHLTVTASGTPEAPRYGATAKIERHAFGMTLTRLDPTIGGTVEITLDVLLK